MSNSVPNHKIHNISFLGSFPRVSIAPKTGLPEFAFIGRSNVGKSSLINYLCDRKKLAKTSGTPGKTQMINLFEVEKQWVIADLPGYGYARVSKKTRAKWSKMITNYLNEREDLVTVFLLVDSRVAPMETDLEKIHWLGEHQIPFSLIFTKSDKLKPDELSHNVEQYLNRLSQDFEDLPNHFITSASNRRGSEELLEYIHFILDSL